MSTVRTNGKAAPCLPAPSGTRRKTPLPPQEPHKREKGNLRFPKKKKKNLCNAPKNTLNLRRNAEKPTPRAPRASDRVADPLEKVGEGAPRDFSPPCPPPCRGGSPGAPLGPGGPGALARGGELSAAAAASPWR